MAELQRTLAAERARSDRLAVEARRQGVEETLIALGRQNQVKEVRGKIIKLFNLKYFIIQCCCCCCCCCYDQVCWNCGRRANETCSGCQIARYCSTFCQHKHWEIHHKICGRAAHQPASSTATTTNNNNISSNENPSPPAENALPFDDKRPLKNLTTRSPVPFPGSK